MRSTRKRLITAKAVGAGLTFQSLDPAPATVAAPIAPIKLTRRRAFPPAANDRPGSLDLATALRSRKGKGSRHAPADLVARRDPEAARRLASYQQALTSGMSPSRLGVLVAAQQPTSQQRTAIKGYKAIFRGKVEEPYPVTDDKLNAWYCVYVVDKENSSANLKQITAALKGGILRSRGRSDWAVTAGVYRPAMVNLQKTVPAIVIGRKALTEDHLRAIFSELQPTSFFAPT